MSLAEQYLQGCQRILETVARQRTQIEQAADWFAQAILAGRVVHLFGAGHSRIAVEEMWPRYGSFPGFNPIVELSLTFHNLVSGANGQRQAMFLENQRGLAERILRNFDLSAQDAALVVSSGGCNVVPIEIAQIFRRHGIKVVAIVSRRAQRGQSESPSGRPQALRLCRPAAGQRRAGRRCPGRRTGPRDSRVARFDHRQLPAGQLPQSGGRRQACPGRSTADGAERELSCGTGAIRRTVRGGLRRARPADGATVRASRETNSCFTMNPPLRPSAPCGLCVFRQFVS